jgi:hypothetical protein
MEKQENSILIILTMLCHVVLNMQETKHGMQTSEEILREITKHGFERMCIVYERLGANVFFYIYAIMYIQLYIYKCIYTYYNLFLCL